MDIWECAGSYNDLWERSLCDKQGLAKCTSLVSIISVLFEYQDRIIVNFVSNPRSKGHPAINHYISYYSRRSKSGTYINCNGKFSMTDTPSAVAGVTSCKGLR